jgi:hypothetical protein
MNVSEAAGLGVAIEGRLEPIRDVEPDAALPVLSVFTRGTRFIDVFNTGRSPSTWTAKASHDWIKLSVSNGDLHNDTRLRIAIDWDKAPQGEKVSGQVDISGAGATRSVHVPLFNPQSPRPGELRGFVESGGVVSMEAEHFTRQVDRGGAGWQVIPGLGRPGDSMAVFPTTVPSVELAQTPTQAPALEYQLFLFKPAQLAVTCYLVPTHPLRDGRGQRYAVGLDDQAPQEVIVSDEVQSKAWSQNVLNATSTGFSTHETVSAGPHVLKIYMVDPGVVLDKIVVDTGGVRPSYLGPTETKAVAVSGP